MDNKPKIDWVMDLDLDSDSDSDDQSSADEDSDGIESLPDPGSDSDSDSDDQSSVDEGSDCIESLPDSDSDDQSSVDEGSDCIESFPYDVAKKMTRRQWQINYDMTLCSRLGIFCYNFQKGTDYNFEFVSKTYTKFQGVSLTKLFIITKASMNPADSSPLTFETFINFSDGLNGELWWETTACRVKGSKEADHEWDYEAIHEWYKGELPKWLSDDDDNHQHCYVVQESELLDNDNWWLHLFSEFAFYTKWNGKLRPHEVADSLPLVTQKVTVETRGEAEREPREKLKASNAVFYISFVCGDDPLTREVTSYRAVVRKTMDGKPGHMRLEVNCWEHEHLTDRLKKKMRIK